MSNISKSVAFVGSGPISLIKALKWAENYPNDNIVIFTNEKRLGGAWKSEISPKGHEIENGCHLWSFQPVAYKFLKDSLNIELSEYSAPPYFIYKNKKYKYSVVKTFEGLKQLTSFIRKWNFYWMSELFSYYQFGKNIYQNKYLYPKKGSPELINKLFEKIQTYNSIEIKLETKIEQIEIKDQVKLITKAQNELTFDKVFVTSISHLKNIEFNNEIIDLEPETSEFIHFLISSEKLPNQSVGYCRLIGDSIIHRYTDISYQTNFEENLFLVGIFEKAFHKHDQDTILNHIKKVMSQSNIIAENCDLKLENIFRYKTNYIPLEKRKAIKLLPDTITLLHSTDLMYGIKRIALNKY